MKDLTYEVPVLIDLNTVFATDCGSGSTVLASCVPGSGNTTLSCIPGSGNNNISSSSECRTGGFNDGWLCFAGANNTHINWTP